MIHRLPPLKSVEAFVVVARLLSFSKASDTLNITQSAVTRRIQNLEEDLGFGLFQRLGNKLALTANGRNYLLHAGPAFDTLHQGTRMLRAQRSGARVRIRLAQSLALSWLVPDLGNFNSRHPHIRLEIETATSDGDFAVEDVDLMISFGKPEKWGGLPDNWNGLRSEPLLTSKFYPVCAPKLAEEIGHNATVDSMIKKPLIGLEQLPDAWNQWFAEVDPSWRAPVPEYSFDNLQLTFHAAANGLGLALGSDVLCATYFERQLLMPAPGTKASIDGIFYMVGRDEEWNTSTIRAVRHWLVQLATDFTDKHISSDHLGALQEIA